MPGQGLCTFPRTPSWSTFQLGTEGAFLWQPSDQDHSSFFVGVEKISILAHYQFVPIPTCNPPLCEMWVSQNYITMMPKIVTSGPKEVLSLLYEVTWQKKTTLNTKELLTRETIDPFYLRYALHFSCHTFSLYCFCPFLGTEITLNQPKDR